MEANLEEPAAPKTLTVPDAGRIYFGLGRNAAYQAAKRGDIPTIRIGRLLRVPVAAMERRLEHADLNNLMVAHGATEIGRSRA
jgi:hypothetical protein